jgi:hypothetical protein
MPSRASLSAKERDLYSKLRQLLTQPGLLRGNLVEMHRRCGKRRCRCRQDPAGRHRSLYLGLSLNGKRRMVYIPADWEGRVRQWATRHARARALLEQLSRHCLARLQRREG